MSEVKLLPCPFCGGDANLERQGHVCCTTRFCRGAGAFDNYGTPSEQNASAVSRWNTRANLAERDAEVEELRAEVTDVRASAVDIEKEAREAWKQATHWRRKASRAERLAEALRAERRWWVDRKADAIREQVGGLTRGDPGAIARCDATIQRIDAALEQENDDA